MSSSRLGGFPITRRDFVGGCAGLALVAGGCGVAGMAPRATGPRTPLIVRSRDPYCAEAPVDTLARAWITPTPLFFVLDHGEVPLIAPEDWVLEIAGAVRRPGRWTLDELRRLPALTMPATVVCAGNRRREFEAVRDQVQWGAGAVGNAWWTGVPLARVLAVAGVLPGSRHVWLEGLDVGERGRFGGSIPLARALDPDQPPVLLAYAMNGDPLSPVHGFPLRALVPGYIGARSVKWLARVVVSERSSPNPYFAASHRIDGEAIMAVPVNAAIGWAERAADGVRVGGYAIAGDGAATVAGVDVAVDGGPWTPAVLGEAVPGCWSLWTITVARPGRFELVARATDTHGVVQPERAAWNDGGYLYNAWPRLRVNSVQDPGLARR